MSQRQPIFNAKPAIAMAFFHRIRRNVQPAGDAQKMKCHASPGRALRHGTDHDQIAESGGG
jgi:hypothetical protein